MLNLPQHIKTRRRHIRHERTARVISRLLKALIAAVVVMALIAWLHG